MEHDDLCALAEADTAIFVVQADAGDMQASRYPLFDTNDVTITTNAAYKLCMCGSTQCISDTSTPFSMRAYS